MKTSAAPDPGIRNAIVVYLKSHIQPVSPFYRKAHASSTWPLHFCHHSFWTFCVGHAIVQADNAPDCGVAQGVIHGVPVRHGEKQEEEEREVEKEVERDKEEEKSNNNAHVHG